MKQLAILTAAVAATMLTACNTVHEKMLPTISGQAGEVVIVIEDQVWKSTTDTIINILKADVPGLPQSEPMFDVVRIPNSAFTEIFQRHRNIISCRIAADSAASTPAFAHGRLVPFNTSAHSYPQSVIALQASCGRR